MHRTTLALALAVCALALGLRLTGLDRLQPHLAEPDAYVVDQVRLHRAPELPEAPPHGYFAYPTALARALAVLPEPAVAPGSADAGRLGAHLAAAAGDFLRARLAVALLAALFVPGTFLLARRFLPAEGSLVAALLVAVSLLHLVFSQQARPHGAHATAALAATLAAMRFARAPAWRSFALAALAPALALALLHNGLFAFAPLAVALVVARRGERRFPLAAGIVPLALGALVVWAFYPRPPTLQEEGGVVEFGGHTLKMAKLDGSGLARAGRFLLDYDPGLAWAALGGLAVLLVGLVRRRELELGRRADLAVALGYALPYSAALGVFGETADRFLLPLLPFLACLAGALAQAAWDAGRRLGGVGLAALGPLAVCAFPVYAAWHWTRVRAAPDTVEQAAAWIRLHLEEDEPVLVTPRLALPLVHSAQALELAREDYVTRRTTWISYQLATWPGAGDVPPGLGRWDLRIAPGKLVNRGGPPEMNAWIDESGARFAVVERSRLTEFLAGTRTLRATIAARGVLQAIFTGEGEGRCLDVPIDYQDTPGYVGRILEARAFGPCIEVWALDLE